MLYDLLLLGIPLLLVAGAVLLDLRTRRGFGIALLALALIGLTIWLTVAFEQAMETAPSSEQFGVAVVMVVYILIGYFCTLALFVGALVEAGMARQWRWFVGLLVAVLAPGLNVLENEALHLSVQKTPVSGSAELLSPILLPALAVLAYGLFRIVRPTKPRAEAGSSMRSSSSPFEAEGHETTPGMLN